MKITLFTTFAAISTVSAFTSGIKSSTSARSPSLKSTVEAPPGESVEMEYKPLLRDPLGLYPANAPERQEGRIVPLEQPISEYQDKTVTDPLNLYKGKVNSNAAADRSMSLPFLKRPEALDGTLPGDRGFDPFNFASSPGAVDWYRQAEIKHARLAMLAAVGWPLAELFDKKIASALDMVPTLVSNDRVPSILNGGLSQISPAYWVFILSLGALAEGIGFVTESEAKQAGKPYTPGDLGFDPLGLFGKTVEDRKFKLEAELFNGRLGMLAITGFAIQEWLTQSAVINQTPIFFKPIWAALEQLQESAGNMMQSG